MIALNYPVDGTFMTSQGPNDFRGIFIGFPQCANLIMFVLGELGVDSL